MGRKMIKSTASSFLSQSEAGSNASQQGDEYEAHGIDLLKAEASLDYLCNLSTHRYLVLYVISFHSSTLLLFSDTLSKHAN